MDFLAGPTAPARVPPTFPGQPLELFHVSLDTVPIGQVLQVIPDDLIQTLTHSFGNLACGLHEIVIDRKCDVHRRSPGYT